MTAGPVLSAVERGSHRRAELRAAREPWLDHPPEQRLGQGEHGVDPGEGRGSAVQDSVVADLIVIRGPELRPLPIADVHDLELSPVSSRRPFRERGIDQHDDMVIVRQGQVSSFDDREFLTKLLVGK